MYHRISEGGQNDVDRFATHLRSLKKNYPFVWPGEQHPSTSVCLTFDDAYADFYHFVFPLLQELELKAVLAVPVKFILDDCSHSMAERLAVPYQACMEGDTYQRLAPFCTWKEIKTMHNSGLVKIASHSYTHADLTRTHYIEQELSLSKHLLEKNLEAPIESFIYPYGKMTRSIQTQVEQHYRYAFRIGNASNRNWNTSLYYRINADPYWQQQRDLTCWDQFNYQLKYWKNRVRAK